MQRSWLGPDWLFKTAEKINPSRRASNAKRYEPQLLDVAEYLTLKRQGPRGADAAEKRFLSFIAAERLNEDAAQTRVLKLLILGAVPADELVQRTGITAEVATAWEKLFFDCREQRASLTWLETHVIAKAMRHGDAEFASQVRLAIAAGADGVRLILDAETRPPLDEADALIRRRLKLHSKATQAAAMPLKDSDCMQQIKLQTQLMFEEQRIKLAEQKLAARCADQLRRHERSMARLRLAEQRLRAKLADADRKNRADTCDTEFVKSKSPGFVDDQTVNRRGLDTGAQSALAGLRWAESSVAAPQVATRVTGRACRRKNVPHTNRRRRQSHIQRTSSCGVSKS